MTVLHTGFFNSVTKQLEDQTNKYAQNTTVHEVIKKLKDREIQLLKTVTPEAMEQLVFVISLFFYYMGKMYFSCFGTQNPPVLGPTKQSLGPAETTSLKKPKNQEESTI